MGHSASAYFAFGTVVPEKHKFSDEFVAYDHIKEGMSIHSTGNFVLGEDIQTTICLSDTVQEVNTWDILKLKTLEEPKGLAGFATFCRKQKLPEPSWMIFSNFG